MKKFLITLLILIVLFVVATFLLNTFLPQKIKKAAITFASETLGKDLQLGKVTVSIIKGIRIDDIVLSDPHNENPPLVIKRLRVIPFYPSLLSQRLLIVSLYLDDATGRLVRKADGTLDLPSFGGDEEKTEKKKRLFLKGLTANNVTLSFEDKTNGFQKDFKNLEVTARFTLASDVTLDVLWPGYLTAQGRYNLLRQQADLTVTLSHLDLPDFQPYLKGVTIREGYIQDATLTVSGKDVWNVQGTINTRNLVALRFLGQQKIPLIVEGNLTLLPSAQITKDTLEVTAQGTLSNATIKNIPSMDPLTIAQATFSVDQQTLTVEKLEGTYNNTPLTLSGQLTDFANPHLTARGSASLPLSQLVTTAKRMRGFSFDYQGPGNVALTFTAEGKTKALAYTYSFNLADATLGGLTALAAQGNGDNRTLTITKATARYKNIPLEMTATLKDFNDPKIQTTIHASDILHLEATLAYRDPTLFIDTLLLQGAQSRIAGHGSALFTTRPEINLEGLGKISCQDILEIITLLGIDTASFKKADVQGIFDIKFITSALPQKKEWELKLAGTSDTLKAYQIEAQKVRIEAYKNSEEFTLSPFIATVCGGKVDFRARVTVPSTETLLNLVVNDIDLAQARQQLKLKNKTLSGKLSGEMFVKNKSLTEWTTMDGQGKVAVSDGNIWELNPFKGFGKMLPGENVDSILFQEGYTNIIFKGKDIAFEAIDLRAPELSIKGGGKLTLSKPFMDSPIDFRLFPEFNPNFIGGSDDLKGILSGALGKILVVNVKGPLKKPTTKKEFLLPDVIKGITDFFGEILANPEGLY